MYRNMFEYHLPQELIAQRPASVRDSSRLMCVERATGTVSHHIFRDITEMLKPGDLLVVNDSKVIPARLLGNKKGTGAGVEFLLLNDMGNDRWECLVKPGKRLRAGAKAEFGGGELVGEIMDEIEGGNRIVQFSYDKSESFFSVLDRVGIMPLPHYITAPLLDNDEYQTVYAKYEGSAAAPTAGFHFTDELIETITKMGIGFAQVTLHVGLGTFRPVKEEDITKHHMHRESYTISEQTAEKIKETKRNGGRVISVGTTTCRALESAAQKFGEVTACSDTTNIFIYPGYEFKAIDALITNFHLPGSTLIMLVSAFAGYENTIKAYNKAIEERYRFFSFGDAMYIY